MGSSHPFQFQVLAKNEGPEIEDHSSDAPGFRVGLGVRVPVVSATLERKRLSRSQALGDRVAFKPSVVPSGLDVYQV
ncbi:hypothetical protein Mp_3g07880 [Marchantia polymorpha subsp. ruderalis]|uniref:Uncharacterized protein n=2 Tax=Marchantia polymorpha TaxID=3197 RepID=A0AAF6AYI3_MARPO|nr:hypothetical protein MARPO_0006s0265 [Marchantia polymorpha]BBN04817.1 hypothetical protein Mp_3g07880 [Marchantia polymorpha subsp. ruderalis]|eukprot:PTQ48269.1 hypothetical protein MARPO_0006s0265 [Marchantia polymorpha]